ncbi:slipin family protein [Hippea maritima]|uniref:Band 7 protein n=1 Tax=Hippea maritima (strain ATCC 700847 / DSM 10411 / MH2) TaxID=760142 RepID=F2LY29_HIPMA|nr:slipin family protein [Hippea maritima]AEA33294.1 band 7 protein [Hippea maritima DSM 10411]
MFFFVLVAIVVAVLLTSIRVIKEYERAVIFRLGRVIGAKGPGIFFLWPIIDSMTKVNLRLMTVEIQPQDVITKDNVTIKISAVVYFKVVDPVKSVIQVNNYFYAIEQLSQTTLRSICGQAELDKLLSEREKINTEIQEILDKHSDSWGVKVTLVELKQIDLPQDMQRAMARQAEAERDRRAKVISAEGEYQAAKKLREAAQIISEYPQALQLRYLQTLNEISAKNNTTTILPIPLDLIRGFSQKE